MATWNGAVAQSADDATELNGTMNRTGTTLNANSTTQFIGLRFASCPIPPGSTISSAVITVNVQNTTNDDPDVNIKCQLGDAAAFGTGSNDITNRSKTTAATQWTATAILAGTENTPNFATVVQEVVNDGGWAINNALGVFFLPRNNSSALTIFSYDNGSNWATIAVDYTPPGGTSLLVGRLAGHTIGGKL